MGGERPPVAAARRIGELRHLARRLHASLRSVPPSAHDEAWARSWLSPAEAALWARHRPNDRRHTLAVARAVASSRVDHSGGGDVPSWVMAAALLHDIGKIEADLPIPGRVTAGLLKLLGVRRAPGVLGRYLGYPATGAALLRAAGADEAVAAWAACHHQPPASWPDACRPWGAVLAAADDRAV